MKTMRLLAIAAALSLALSGTALAAGNTTEVEQKWLEFRKAVNDQMVKDGKMTRQEADTEIKNLQSKLAASPGDSIMEKIQAHQSHRKDRGMGPENRPGSAEE